MNYRLLLYHVRDVQHAPHTELLVRGMGEKHFDFVEAALTFYPLHSLFFSIFFQEANNKIVHYSRLRGKTTLTDTKGYCIWS